MGPRWTWLVVVATAAGSVVEMVVMRASGVPFLSLAAFRNAFPIVNVGNVVGALVGAVILSRHPRHRIGWLFCWGQLGVGVGLVARAVADGVMSGRLGGSPRFGRAADLLGNLLGSQFALVLLAALLLLAPDGRLPSHRWRPVAVVLAAGYVTVVLGLLLTIGRGLTPSVEVVIASGQLGVLAGLLGAVAALLARLRRATGDVRQQLRWIVAAAAVLASAPLIALTLYFTGTPLTPVWVIAILHLGYVGIPVATGFAVLRYRLYDIDRLVGGSVVLAVLGVLAVGAYVIVVGLLGTAVADASSRWLPLMIFVVAVLAFQPMRRSVRRLANRLVYGPQAMSYDALARYTRALAASTTGTPFLDATASAAGQLVNARRCTAVVLGPGGPAARATWEAGTGRADATWSVPVRHGGEAVGRLELELAELPAGHARRRTLLAALADSIADGFVQVRLEVALREHAQELQQLNAELDAGRQRLLASRDVGRRQVADRIRTEVVDRLTPVAASVAEVANGIVDGRSTILVDDALVATGQAIDQLRRITSTVYSRRLAEDGLVSALRSELSRPDLVLTVRGTAGWPAAVEAWLFACCSDLLRDVRGEAVLALARSGAETAEVVLTCSPPIDPGWAASTRERAEVLGGTVDVGQRRLVLRLPIIETTSAV